MGNLLFDLGLLGAPLQALFIFIILNVIHQRPYKVTTVIMASLTLFMHVTAATGLADATLPGNPAVLHSTSITALVLLLGYFFSKERKIV